jgi:hypothetical protein
MQASRTRYLRYRCGQAGRARLDQVHDDLNELEELEYSNKPDELSLAEVEEKESQCCRAIHDAEDAVLGAKPCTHAGVAAQLIFAAEIYSVNESDEYLVPFLVNSARTIDGPLVSKIGLSEYLAERLSDDA